MAPLHYRIGPDVGGSELSWAYELLRAVAAQNVRVDAIVGDAPGFTAPGGVEIDETFPGSTENFFTDALGPRLRFVAAYTRLALKRLRRHRYDVVHHVLPLSPSTFNPIVLSRGFPLSIDRSTGIVIGPYQGVHEERFADESAFNRFAGRASARRARPAAGLLEAGAHQLHCMTMHAADRIVALTPAARASLEGVVSLDRVTVIPAGIDHTRFPYIRRGPPAQPFTIITAAYLLKRKGTECILRAAKSAMDQGVALRVVVAGAGPELEALQTQARELGISPFVEFAGLLRGSAMQDLYARGDLYISMSRAETFGVAVLEAMSTGMPVISADNVGAREIVQPGVTGFLVDKGDVDSLVLALRRYADNPELIRLHGDTAAALVRKKYDWGEIGKAYARVYEEVSAR